MRRFFSLALLPMLLLGACSQGGHNAAAKAPADGARGIATKCDAANLTLPAEYVAARFDDKDITMKDLGDELAAAEHNALREYCSAVHEARTMALENHLRESLVERAALAEGKSVEDYLRGRLEASMQPPSDEEVQRFYNEHSPPNAPSLEEVRPQVMAAMQRDKAGEAIEALMSSLEKSAKVERRLPDVRPPPADVGVASHTPTTGADKPVVEVIEFADFECPYCSVMANALNEVKPRFEGKAVRFAYRHFPLAFHPKARPAAEFSQCAKEQGRFWQVHDHIYANMSEMGRDELMARASDLGLDSAKLEACLASERPGREVEADFEAGKRVGVEGTPTLYINGRRFQGRPTAEGIAQAIEAELQSGS
jgi:protein-disulfide isomerase